MVKKSLVFIIESLQLGGAEKSLVTLLQNLDYTKYQVDLILFKKDGIFNKYVPEQVNIISVELSKLNLIQRLNYKIQRQFNFTKKHHAQILWSIINSKFNASNKVYDFAIAYNQGFVTYYTSQFIQASVKFAWINTDYQKAGYKIKFDYPIYRQYRKVVVVSPEAKTGLENELSKINQKLEIEVIKDITDKKILLLQSEEKLNVPFNSSQINIVTVGRLSKPKGLHLAIESCKKLIDKGYKIHWYIVGEGSERNHLEKLISKNEIEKYITLTGMTDNPYPYMKACDIYVQTSLFEGLGLTVIEAALLNKPIVTTNFPTAYGIINDEETGLIAEMNSDSIVTQIERYLNDQELKKKIIFNLSQQKNKDKEVTLNKVEKLLNAN